MRSRRLEACGAEVMAAVEEERDQTLVESCVRVGEHPAPRHPQGQLDTRKNLPLSRLA